MYHLARINNGFLSPLGSASNEETAKKLVEHYESGLKWKRQTDGSWIAKRSDYLYYTVSDHTEWGNIFSGRK